MGLRDKLLNGDSNISLKGLEPVNAAQIPLDKTFNRTNLDMEDPLPSGGPITKGLPYSATIGQEQVFFPGQTFTSKNTYIDYVNSRGLAAAGSLPRVVGIPSEGAIGGTGRRGN
jgi:hypothetical protein